MQHMMKALAPLFSREHASRDQKPGFWSLDNGYTSINGEPGLMGVEV